MTSGQDAALKRNLAALDAILAGRKAGKSKEEIARRAQAARAEIPVPKAMEIGDSVKDEGIYLGKWEPKELGKTFNVYAAPQNLPKLMAYVDAARHIAGLKSWHGYDGENYKSEKELRQALAEDEYKGGWIIPPLEVLCGKNAEDQHVTSDSIFAHKDKGAFKGTFDFAEKTSGMEFPKSYWSSTIHREFQYATYILASDIADGSYGHFSDSSTRLSCRPVRLVGVKP